MDKRKAFNFYRSYYEVALELPQAAQREYLMALLHFQFTGEEPKLKGMAKFALMSQKHSIIRQLEGYRHGQKGGAPPKGTDNPPPKGSDNHTPLGNENQVQGEVQVQVEEEDKGEDKGLKDYKKMLLSEIEISDVAKTQYFDIALSFQKLFRAHLEEAGASTDLVDKAKGTWIDDIRLMIEKDGYSLTDLRDVYKFLQRDLFWKQNILSTSKLRDQMASLKLKMHNGKKKEVSKEATTWDELAEIIQTSFKDE